MPKVNKKLNDLQIRNAKPEAKDYRLYDTDGLTLLVRKSGTKVWQYRYKYAGLSNIYTIGRYPECEAKQARASLIEVKTMLDKGINPNDKKKTDRKALEVENKYSFKAIAEEWFSKQEWSKGHALRVYNRLLKDVYPVIGGKSINKISIPDIIAILRNIEERGAYDVAKRIAQYCTQIFDYAILQGICENNPALGRGKFIKRPKTINRPHMLETELPEFLARLNASEQTQMNLAVKLLLLTFVRPGELRSARWDHIDLDGRVWAIPAHLMKKDRDHLVPLSKQAVNVLNHLKIITSDKEYLFPAANKNKPVSDVALIKAVRKLSDDKSVPHGFRHTASTILHEKGFLSDHIEMQLSHVEENKVKGTYNKAQYFQQRKEMMQWWADYLDEVSQSGSIVEFSDVRKAR